MTPHHPLQPTSSAAPKKRPQSPPTEEKNDLVIATPELQSREREVGWQACIRKPHWQYNMQYSYGHDVTTATATACVTVLRYQDSYDMPQLRTTPEMRFVSGRWEGRHPRA